MTLLSVMTALTFYLMPAPTVLYGGDMTAVVNLPAGYFTVQSGLDAPDGYISVVYDDLVGFVRKDEVTQVDYTPVTKYEKTVTFTCDNDGQSVNLRESPHKSADILAVLKNGQSGRSYGNISGDALIPGADDVWYYVNCDGIKGYVYYAHVSVTPTPPNIIEKEKDPDPEVPADAPAVTENRSMSATAAAIFIVALCIPVPFIMYFLFKKPKE